MTDVSLGSLKRFDFFKTSLLSFCWTCQCNYCDLILCNAYFANFSSLLVKVIHAFNYDVQRALFLLVRILHSSSPRDAPIFTSCLIMLISTLQSNSLYVEYPEGDSFSRIYNKRYSSSLSLSLSSRPIPFVSLLVLPFFLCFLSPYLQKDIALVLITTCLTDSLHRSSSVSVKSLITPVRRWGRRKSGWREERNRLKKRRIWREQTRREPICEKQRQGGDQEDEVISSCPFFSCSPSFPLLCMSLEIMMKRPLPGRFTATLFIWEPKGYKTVSWRKSEKKKERKGEKEGEESRFA